MKNTKEDIKETKKLPEWHQYKGTTYLYVDLRGIDNETDFVEYIKNSTEMALKEPDNSICVLMDVNNFKTTPEAMRKVQKYGLSIQPKMKKTATIGVVGIMSLLLRLYITVTGSKMKFFTDKSAALNYITNE